MGRAKEEPHGSKEIPIEKSTFSLFPGSFDQLFDQFVAGPVVPGKDLFYAAGRAYDDSAEVMVQAALLAPENLAELFGNGGNIDEVTGKEVPMLWLRAKALRVGFEDGRSVEIRIERNGKQVPVRKRRLRQEFLLDLGKIAGHPRAEIRQGTAGEDKGHSDGLAFELAGAHGLAQFIGKMIFGQRVADFQRLHIARNPNRAARRQFGG